MKIKYQTKTVINGIKVGQLMMDTSSDNELWIRKLDNWYKVKDDQPTNWDVANLDKEVKQQKRFKYKNS